MTLTVGGLLVEEGSPLAIIAYTQDCFGSKGAIAARGGSRHVDFQYSAQRGSLCVSNYAVLTCRCGTASSRLGLVERLEISARPEMIDRRDCAFWPAGLCENVGRQANFGQLGNGRWQL
jgi:hypothetical protein